MSKQQKQIAIVAAGALVLLLVYRWYQGQSASSTTTTGTAAPDTSGSDFASLAGQEQSDVAGLQDQNSQLLGQEQSDVANLQGAISGLTAQEQSDVSGLTGQVGSLSSAIEGTPDMSAEVAALAAGVQQLNRAQTATVQTHRGGAFYNYYVKVTGHAPPARVQMSSLVYQAWKQGIKATALQAHPAHPSAPRNTHVAHPNPHHTPQPTHHPAPANPKPRAPVRNPAKPPARATRPAAPKPKTKPKTSGRRR